MSARQRFVANANANANANAKTASGQVAQDDANKVVESATVAPAETTSEHCAADSTLPFKDASNSPRPDRRNARDGTQAHKDYIEKESKSAPSGNGNGALTGVDKPLNIGSLTRTKARTTGDSTPSQNKKQKYSAVDKLKENGPAARARSQKVLPLSPSRRKEDPRPASPFTFGSADPSTLSDNPQPYIIAPQQSRLSDGTSGAHTSTDDQIAAGHAQYSRSTMPSLEYPFSDTGYALMASLSPSAPRPYRDSLGPAKREVFPMRMDLASTDPAHIRSSSSSSKPAQQRLSEERIYDFQVPFDRPSIGNPNAPINIDAHDAQDDQNQKHDQHFLRRATKRIGQLAPDDDDVVYSREGKRAKVGIETITTQHDTMHDRPSTPGHGRHYQPSARSQLYDCRPQQAHQMHSQFPLSPQMMAQPPQSTPPSAELEQQNGLYRLLSVDVERYLNENVGQYEAAKKRWTNCSIEDWQAGADEMSKRFDTIVDFAKEHIATKFTLFATLHNSINQQKAVLEERDTMLTSMRKKLVKDSGAVLGGGGTS